MGNPHAVLTVADVATAPVQQLGPAIEHQARFPQRANVGFMAIRGRDRIDLRVFERGVGETLACGTGACAAAVIARSRGLVNERVLVRLRGGELVISWPGSDEPVWMSGPAEQVFDGTIEI
jgi:diaminopimelate epimerase